MTGWRPARRRVGEDPSSKWGHAVVWLLLAAGLGLAAVRQGWTRASSLLCSVAGIGYLAFLAALFTG